MSNHMIISFILAVFSNLITLIIVPIIISLWGFFREATLAEMLPYFSVALFFLTISLIIRFRYAPKRLRVIRVHEQPHVYLVERNVTRHIPDEDTFAYLGQLYGFDWKDIELVTNDRFKKNFSTGSALPSIRPHCERLSEKK